MLIEIFSRKFFIKINSIFLSWKLANMLYRMPYYVVLFSVGVGNIYAKWTTNFKTTIAIIHCKQHCMYCFQTPIRSRYLGSLEASWGFQVNFWYILFLLWWHLLFSRKLSRGTGFWCKIVLSISMDQSLVN